MQRTDGKGKLILLGPDSPVKQMLSGALERLRVIDDEPDEAEKEEAARQRNAGAEELLRGDTNAVRQSGATAGLTREDCVLLFGRYAESGEQPCASARNEAEDCRPDTGWIEELMDAIGQIRRIRPRGVLFVSDTMVYGKLFGEQRLLRENELGYVCHTSADGMTAQWMRTAEHLCARLAREEGLSVKIVRADWEHIPAVLQEDGEQGEILNSLFDIWENGIAGEAYNLSGLSRDTLARKNAECAKARSPLAPVTVLPDIGKAENYAAS